MMRLEHARLLIIALLQCGELLLECYDMLLRFDSSVIGAVRRVCGLGNKCFVGHNVLQALVAA